jgi:adenosylcobinamide amidohydrolase
VHPELVFREEGGRSVPLLVWRLPEAFPTISSGPLGGGLGLRGWVINATVPMSYNRDDPDAHLTEIATDLGLSGAGTGLLTGVDVVRREEAVDENVTVWATVGLGKLIRAAEPAGTRAGTAAETEHAGTINIIAWVPARLSHAALGSAAGPRGVPGRDGRRPRFFSRPGRLV